MKKRSNLVIGVCAVLVVVIIGVLIFSRVTRKGDLVELTYAEVMEKMQNGDSFPLCISRTTCSHCKDYKPRLKKVAIQYGVNIYYIDIDKYTKEEQKEFEKVINYGGSTPTTVFLKNGQETTTSNRISGDVSEDKIVDKLRTNEFIK